MPRDHDDAGALLSPQGRQRRASMLEDLSREVVRSARRRRARRCAAGGAAVIVALVGAGVVLNSMRPGQTPPARPALEIAEAPAPADAPPAGRIAVTRINTDKGLTDRLRIDRVDRVAVESISDDDLLRTLAAMGRPTGMVRSQGQVWLTASVVDEPPSAAEERPEAESS